MEALKIIIVDDNVKYRESLADLITQVLKFEVIAQASDGEEFLQISNKLRPDIILMDLLMPKMDGFLATQKYMHQFPYSKVVAVTNSIEKAYLVKLIEAGFKACIFKHRIFDDLKPALEAVMQNKFWFPDNIEIDSV